MDYSLRRLLRPLAQLLPSGLAVPIMTGPLKGSKWIVGAAAGEGKGLSIIFNQSEPAQVHHAIKLLDPNHICFDIGANVGFYTLLFSQYAKAVYAFEPLIRNLKYLIRLIDINKLPNARIIPCAVADDSKVSYFSEGEDHSRGKLDHDGLVPVMVTTCDRFVSETKIVPDLIKIDVEGSEFDVLKGASKLLETHHPSILLSIHSDRLRKDCLEFLAAKNYKAIIPLDSDRAHQATEYAIHHKLFDS